MAIQHLLIFVYVFTASTWAAKNEPISRLGQTLADSNSETTDLSSTYTTIDPSFIDTRTKVTVPYQNSKCRDMATDFVYQKNFCLGAQDPESYVQVARPRYTCLNRCGEAPTFGTETFECGCDAICRLFKDCCKDMAEICPELYSTGETDDSIALQTMYQDCAIYKKFYKRNNEPFSLSTKYVLFTPSIVNRNKVLHFKPRTLAEFTDSLTSYSVVDIQTKLVFKNFASYRAYKLTDETAYFIPKVADFTCSPANSETVPYPSALQILPWCRVAQVEDAVTHYHRPCKKYEILNCQCEDGSFLKDHVHNVCLDQSNYQHRLYRFPLREMQAKRAVELPRRNEKCINRILSKYGIARTRISEDKTPDSVIKMRVIPVVKRHQNSSHRTDEVVDFSEEVDGETKVGFIVELSGTLERRFFCPSLHSRLQNCWLEECAEGGLVWSGHDSHGLRPRRSCISPVGARVLQRDGFSHIHLCSCLGVMAILEDLGLWEIRLAWSQNTSCFLTLKPIPKNHKPLNEIYEFTEPKPYPEGGTFSTTMSDELGVGNLSKRLAKISQSCPDDGDLDFQICFILTDADKDTERESQFCLSWGLSDLNGSVASVAFNELFTCLFIILLSISIF